MPRDRDFSSMSTIFLLTSSVSEVTEDTVPVFKLCSESLGICQCWNLIFSGIWQILHWKPNITIHSTTTVMLKANISEDQWWLRHLGFYKTTSYKFRFHIAPLWFWHTNVILSKLFFLRQTICYIKHLIIVIISSQLSYVAQSSLKYRMEDEVLP